MRFRISTFARIYLVGITLTSIACTGPGSPASTVGKTAGNVGTGMTTGSVAKAPGSFSLNGDIDGSAGIVATQGLDPMRCLPNNIVNVKPNAKIEIELANVGATVHNVVAPGMGLATAVKVNPRQKGTATLTAPGTPGIYQFWCNEPGHAEAGMIGQVVVSE